MPLTTFKQLSVYCVIPARWSSTRFPGKLLQMAGGKTVIQHTFEKACACPDVDGVFVATDDERIAKHIQELGGLVIFTSPDCKNGTERIYEAVQKHPLLQKSDCIVNLQGDHPCTEPATLSAIIRALRTESSPMATAVTPIHSRDQFLSPHIVKCVFDRNHNALYFSRSPIPYTREGTPLKAYAHIGTYGYKTSFLKSFVDAGASSLQEIEDLEQLKVLEKGDSIKIVIVDEIILGIDTPNDLEKLKEIVCHPNIFSSQAESFLR